MTQQLDFVIAFNRLKKKRRLIQYQFVLLPAGNPLFKFSKAQWVHYGTRIHTPVLRYKAVSFTTGVVVFKLICAKAMLLNRHRVIGRPIGGEVTP